MNTICLDSKFIEIRDTNELQEINGGMGFLAAVGIVCLVIICVALVAFAGGVLYEVALNSR